MTRGPNPAVSPAQQVSLEVPEVGRLSARVEQVDSSTVTLAITTPDALRPGPATIEFTSPRGLHRVPGTVAPEADTIRFEQQLEPSLVQRRQFARAQAILDVRVWPDDRPGDELCASALNVSGGGMLIAAGHGMREQETFVFELELGGGAAPVRGRGRVVRVAERGAAGVAFEGVPEQARERLVHFVFERQRHERLLAG